MATTRVDSCWVVAIIAFSVILATLGAALMGTASTPSFNNPQFVGGFSMLMLLAVVLVNVVLWIVQASCSVSMIVNIFVILLIIGATLVGLAPHVFNPPNPMFIVGFTFLITDAVIVAVGAITLCLYSFW